jgi:hypothetical protein
MDRKIISFDADGVLAECGYTPPEDRNNKVYCKKSTVCPEVIPALHHLSMLYDIYVISTRSHHESNLGLRAWLHWILGLELDTIAGVITGPSGFPRGMTFGPEAENIHQNKAQIVEALGVLVHIDDNPDVIKTMPGYGVLLVSDMPSSKAAAGLYPTCYDWEGIMEFLTTPGMTLHGSEGVSVVSPCEEGFQLPKIDPATVKALAESLSPKIQ